MGEANRNILLFLDSPGIMSTRKLCTVLAVVTNLNNTTGSCFDCNSPNHLQKSQKTEREGRNSTPKKNRVIKGSERSKLDGILFPINPDIPGQNDSHG